MIVYLASYVFLNGSSEYVNTVTALRYKYTNRTKVFEHLILSHTNNTKLDFFMKGNMFKFKEILKI